MTLYDLILHIKRTYSSAHRRKRFNTSVGLICFHYYNYFPCVFQSVAHIVFIRHRLNITRLRYIRFETVTVDCGRMNVDFVRESVSESFEKRIDQKTIDSLRATLAFLRILLMSGAELSECV